MKSNEETVYSLSFFYLTLCLMWMKRSYAIFFNNLII